MSTIITPASKEKQMSFTVVIEYVESIIKVAALSVIFTGYSTPAVEYEVLCNKNPSFK
jgi:hypothetical protein